MNDLDVLVGKQVKEIRMNTRYLVFETDDGKFCFEVYGDCCSGSYFYDFIGLDKLRAGKVVSTGDVDDESRLTEPTQDELDEAECLALYGYEIVTDHPEFGDVTSVFSFRNDSNGYYGGWMDQVTLTDEQIEAIPLLKGDHVAEAEDE